MPVNKVVLTDSSVNFNTVKQINDALNTLIQSDESLSSSSKKYFNHCTKSIMYFHVRNTILE